MLTLGYPAERHTNQAARSQKPRHLSACALPLPFFPFTSRSNTHFQHPASMQAVGVWVRPGLPTQLQLHAHDNRSDCLAPMHTRTLSRPVSATHLPVLGL
jgi:hypothetical protein